MGQISLSHVLILLLSIAMWIGAAAVIIFAMRRMGLFGRRPK